MFKLWLSSIALMSAITAWHGGQTQSPPAPRNVYRVRFMNNNDVSVSAQLSVRTGILVMAEGFKPDARSANVADLKVTSIDGEPLSAKYNQQQAQWTLPEPGAQQIHLSYAVHLNGLRAFPAWAHLQYGFFDGDAAYFVMSSILIVPDSIESTDPAIASIYPPQGAELAAPWAHDEGQEAYTSTIAALVNNSIVVGKFSHVSYREDNFLITVALLGKWSERREVVERVIRASVASDLRLFSGTPAGQYLVTLASGDDDGQSFTTSNAISTRLDINSDDTEIWANTIAHELFHHWNARLIHTADMHLAFFVEGFTEYYANRQILAESLIDQQRYWNMAAYHLGAYSYFSYSPNYGVSIAEAGLNKTKNRFGVYDGGWAVALCLDLGLRAESQNRRSLDDVMKLLWQRYGETGQTYSYNDFVKAVSDVVGRDMVPFFAKYVTGKDDLPFRSDLARIGVAVYDQPFGGEAYIKVNPRAGTQRSSYGNFLSFGPSVP
jgi:predicted metalloprotease with PDZ domain